MSFYIIIIIDVSCVFLCPAGETAEPGNINDGDDGDGNINDGGPGVGEPSVGDIGGLEGNGSSHLQASYLVVIVSLSFLFTIVSKLY